MALTPGLLIALVDSRVVWLPLRSERHFTLKVLMAEHYAFHTVITTERIRQRSLLEIYWCDANKNQRIRVDKSEPSRVADQSNLVGISTGLPRRANIVLERRSR